MRRRIAALVTSLTLVASVAACAFVPLPGDVRIPLPGGGPVKPVAIPPGAADQPTPAAEVPDPESDFPEPHEAFAAHFTDPLYYDEGNEFSPFGSDEGFDTLYVWLERRAEIAPCATVRSLIEGFDPGGALSDPESNGPDVDGFVIGAGFALLLYTGQIDAEGKQLTLDALHRTYSSYADSNPREQPVMIRDLESFAPTDCPG